MPLWRCILIQLLVLCIEPNDAQAACQYKGIDANKVLCFYRDELIYDTNGTANNSTLCLIDIDSWLLCNNGVWTKSDSFSGEGERQNEVRVRRLSRKKRGWFRDLFNVVTFGLFRRRSSSSPDRTPPTITCPPVIEVRAEPTHTYAKVTWPLPKALDNRDGPRPVQRVFGQARGSYFSEGQHDIVYRATDNSGNSNTCTVTVIVKKNRCPPPPWPDNGNVRYTSLTTGSTYTVHCKDGYYLNSRDSAPVKCTISGWARHVPNCKPYTCQRTPVVSNGMIVCQFGQAVYGSLCQVVCNDGYRIQGLYFVGCDKHGHWGTVGRCKDVTPPRFTRGSCPDDIRADIDSSDNTALVSWDLPTGSDNSGNTPSIEETHGRRPNTRYKAGSSTIRYTIMDSAGNLGDICVFSIYVSTISCQPPDLKVAGSEHLRYDCPDLYRLGARCTLACMSGYPLGGVTKIICHNDEGSVPPVLRWTWPSDSLAPFCKVSKCHDLGAPDNGALACSLWDYGKMCQIQCQDGYDIPRTTQDALYVCGTSDGKWRPSGNIPDCYPAVNSHTMHLPSKVYYYTGECNSSLANLQQIKENFVTALNSSKFHENCLGIPECRAKFVNVTCGRINKSLQKRSIDARPTSSVTLAYIISFEFTIAFVKRPGKVDEVFRENKHLLSKMVGDVRKEIGEGHFDLNMPDIRLNGNSSFVPGRADFKCPKGMLPNSDKASCNGCPTGQFYNETLDDCDHCPRGTYQDEPNRLGCKKCQNNTSTAGLGSTNQTECLDHCLPGQSSPTGLRPCMNCPTSTYQPRKGQTMCLKCDIGLRTITEGAMQQSDCQVYDIRTSEGKPVGFVNHVNYTAMSLTSWMRLRGNNQTSLLNILSKDGEMLTRIFQENNVSIDIKGKANYVKPIDTGYKIPVMEWFHIGLVINTTQVQLYINGENVLTESVVTLERTGVLQGGGDRIEIDADMLISSFYVFGSQIHGSEFKEWSRRCLVNVPNYIFSIEDLADSRNSSLVVPSVCDATDECKTSPCGNQSEECINLKNGYTCVCKDGYTGGNCEIKPNFCDNNECKNGGTCLDRLTDYTCTCAHGFHGEICDKKAEDGQWSNWSEWSQCTLTCNGGTARRSRNCDNPKPDSDGQNCTGSKFETQTCNKDACPECITLHAEHGVEITCNDTPDLQRCNISCRPGLSFVTPPLTYYECGRTTGYKWNHQNEKNPLVKLPVCSEIRPPTNVAVTMNGHYTSITCSKTNLDIAVEAIGAKLNTLECVKAGLCRAQIVAESCLSTSMTLSLGLNSDIKVASSQVQNLFSNITDPSSQLADLLNQILEVDRTAQSISNNSADFFKVNIDGTSHTIDNGTDGLTVIPTVKCHPGSVRINAFCAECPVGSYINDTEVYPCPKGQFQDNPGQTTCKMCPDGQTTAGQGAVYKSECLSNDTTLGIDQRNVETASEEISHTTVIVAVTLSLAFVIIFAIGSIYFIRRYLQKGVGLPEKKHIHGDDRTGNRSEENGSDNWDGIGSVGYSTGNCVHVENGSDSCGNSVLDKTKYLQKGVGLPEKKHIHGDDRTGNRSEENGSDNWDGSVGYSTGNCVHVENGSDSCGNSVLDKTK